MVGVMARWLGVMGLDENIALDEDFGVSEPEFGVTDREVGVTGRNPGSKFLGGVLDGDVAEVLLEWKLFGVSIFRKAFPCDLGAVLKASEPSRWGERAASIDLAYCLACEYF